MDLRRGIRLDWQFPDPASLLLTARESLDRTLAQSGLPQNGPYPVRFLLRKTATSEAWRIRVHTKSCDLIAGDTEGMRRAIYAFEEMLFSADGPFLKPCDIRRRPVIKTRISRCFFGPIKRPPKNRDELVGEEDYYPEEYLNRLAREGVNGLWLTISFHELCPSRFFPDFGVDAEPRLRRLRQIVERCARYGIGIYPFCIEPRGFGDIPEYLHSREHLARHPMLGGHREGAFTFFCTSTTIGRQYLEEATGFLFGNVPDLAGMIVISMGERPTHCYSNMLWDTGPNNCPRCSRRAPAAVFRDTLNAMKRGIKKGNPRAQLISWLYVPSVLEREGQTFNDFRRELAAIADGFPPDVTFQYNFESLGIHRQLGLPRLIRDYSLAYIGPSAFFTDCARRLNGRPVSAKLQVGCSHEVATVPWVPAPGNLYRKYRAMHRLGVSAAMQGWYFGNYPSLMTRAAGRLSFAPLPRTEREFLHELALPEWGKLAHVAAQAWEHFGAAYREFPANINFAWFGPVHDAIAWPLHLKPVDRGIAPSWLLNHPPSGDRIGECIGFSHTLEEILQLCERMAAHWQRGVDLLRPHAHIPAHAFEISVAEALGLQFRSAHNVVQFYALRETLFQPQPLRRQRALLTQLRQLVLSEIKNSRALIRLCARHSSLGFHSEAEGYKYHPALLHWRIAQLETQLADDFPQIERAIQTRHPLFPEYTGVTPRGAAARCFVQPKDSRCLQWNKAPWQTCRAAETQVIGAQWRAWQKGETLFIQVLCPGVDATASRTDPFSGDHVILRIEPRRLWPARQFFVTSSGVRYDPAGTEPGVPRWRVHVRRDADTWQATFQIPLALFKEKGRHPRLNVIRKTPHNGTFAWLPLHPLPNRLIFGDSNPNDMGWLLPIQLLCPL